MTQEHPSTPPPELVEKWIESTRANDCIGSYPQNYEHLVATQAARWGADQELEACCEWLRHDLDAYELVGLRAVYLDHNLRAARRPKPPSLKEQALAKLPEHPENMASHLKLTPGEVATIRRALESLPD